MEEILGVAFSVCFFVLVFINQKNTDLKQQNEELRKKIDAKENKDAEGKIMREAEKRRLRDEIEDTHGLV